MPRYRDPSDELDDQEDEPLDNQPTQEEEDNWADYLYPDWGDDEAYNDYTLR